MNAADRRCKVEFNGDLSATRYSNPIPTNGARYATLGIGWTDTVSGTLSIQMNNHGIAGLGGEPYDLPIPTQPTGTAGSVVANNIKVGAEFLIVKWVPASGGTGLHFTDESGIAGTVPMVVLK